MKNLKKLGMALNKAEQKNVFGGNNPMPCFCYSRKTGSYQVPCDSTCPDGTQPFCP